MSIQQPSDQSNQAPLTSSTTSVTPLVKGEHAQQMQTEVTLLSQVQSKSRFTHIPIVGWIEAKFVRRSVKTEYINQLEFQFINKASSQEKQRYKAIFSFLRPMLMKTHLEDLPHLEAFWNLPRGVQRFISIIEAFPSSTQGLKFLSQMINTVIQAVKNNPGGTQTALNHCDTVSLMIKERFSGADRVDYVHNMLHVVGFMTPEDFSKFETGLKTFVDKAREIQAERPTLYSAVDQGMRAFQESLYTEELVQVFTVLPQLAWAYAEILDMTIVTNTQTIHENLAMYTKPPSPSNRTLPNLEYRYSRRCTTSREKRVPFHLLQDGDNLIDASKLHTDISITNDKTMETRCLKLPLPFQGQMTQTEARVLLQLLEKTIADPTRFDKYYEQYKLNPDLQAERKIAFSKWVLNAEKEYGKCIFDFNATSKRPTMSYAQDTPEVQEALKNPQDQAAALKVATAKNLYRVKGQLSLLPPSLASHHQVISTLAPQSVSQATNLLHGTTQGSLLLPVTPKVTAQVTFSKKEIQFGETKALEVQTTFQVRGNTSSRTTVYLLKPKQTVEEKIQEISSSSLFERDLLLAKAEFIQQMGEST
jgi:hypothetical protein